MNFFVNASSGNPNLTIRVHLLLLSLTETINASEENPDISAILENDKRVLESRYYTLPSKLPPLEIHFPGQNGLSLLSNQNSHTQTLSLW